MSIRPTSIRPAQVERQLALAARALAANPFTAARAELDRELTEGRAGEEVFAATLARLEPLAGQAMLASSGPERERAFRAYLFALFHRYQGEMTELIADEAKASAPVPAPFALAIVEALEARQIPAARAERLVALFYQTQRAFLF